MSDHDAIRSNRAVSSVVGWVLFWIGVVGILCVVQVFCLCFVLFVLVVMLMVVVVIDLLILVFFDMCWIFGLVEGFIWIGFVVMVFFFGLVVG